jgi:hypothetical protein
MDQRGLPIISSMHTSSRLRPSCLPIRASNRTSIIVVLAIFAMLIFPSSVRAQVATEQQQPMTFALIREGPANVCGKNCREWVSASGKITEETPQQFVDFAKGRDLQGSTVVLESRGGHVLAGIWLGREFRRLGMATTIGKTNLLPPDSSGERRATLSSRAQCQSMCPFVVLGGVLRHVPADASVLVHQIWPAQRMEDAMAATYSARELVAEQRQLGQLARYTIEMGGDIALFESAMRIPPWEVLHPLTVEEVRHVGLNNVDNVFDKAAVKSQASKPERPPPIFLGTAAISRLTASSWEIVEKAGVKILTRRYPLTLQGEEIGLFEVSFACGGKENHKVAYSETRRLAENAAVRLKSVALGVGKIGVPLAVGSSLRNSKDAKIESIASGLVPVAFMTELMRDGGQPLAVATRDSRNVKTTVVVGKTGLSASFDQFMARCRDVAWMTPSGGQAVDEKTDTDAVEQRLRGLGAGNF